MKKVLKIISIALVIVCICSCVFAAEDLTEDLTKDMKVKLNGESSGVIGTFFGMVLGVLQAIGVGVTLVSLVIAGIKYMISSTNDKASIKQQAIPFVIGGTIIFASSTIVKMIANFAGETFN